MKKLSLLAAGALLLSTTGFAFAATSITEGDEAVEIYANEKDQGIVLIQKDKSFYIRTSDGDELVNKKTITLKIGQKLFIINDEHKYVHNVYDTTDKGWVLRKQKPSEVAVVVYDEASQHKLKCAIHPRMKVTVNVE